MDTHSSNIASHLVRMARLQPDKPAIICPWARRGGQLSYAELNRRSDAIASGLSSVGISRGVHTALMVRPGLDLFSLAFALFKCGAIPVLIDPGIGLKNMKSCLDKARPEAFIGIGVAHLARKLLRWAPDSISRLVTVGQPLLPGTIKLKTLETEGARAGAMTIADPAPDDIAAIVFTSGSTGPPKGVVYRHGNFMAQIEALRETYAFQPGEINLPTFPLFALFDPALGMTSIIPEMDPTRPAKAKPMNILRPIREFEVTTMFGSPALLDTVGRWGVAHQISLPSLRRVISAGAPVSPRIIERFTRMLDPGAQLFTPYGATESLPVASISSAEILKETGKAAGEGAGTCVGKPVTSAEVRIIPIRDEVIQSWENRLSLPQGVRGEIVVRSPQTTREYFEAPEQTSRAKIPDGETVRHRMGDLGYFDEGGRLWFCGRKAHLLMSDEGPLFSVPIEGIFNAHPAVFRSALTGIYRSARLEAVLCIEVEKGISRKEKKMLIPQLIEIAASHPETLNIQHFLIHRHFPVDIRHNAKINRAILARWAARKLGGRAAVAGS